MLSKIFSQINLLRFGLAASAIAIILLVLPHADHKGFTYEQNQPWKYPLLTAEFDIPILRDSTSIKVLKDSIDRSFVPFVKFDRSIENNNIARFSTFIKDNTTTTQSALLTSLLKQVYDTGILDNNLSNFIEKTNKPLFRQLTGTNDQTR